MIPYTLGDLALTTTVENNPAEAELRTRAIVCGARETSVGALAVESNTKSRLAKYLEVIWGKPTKEQRQEIVAAFAMMRDQKMIRVDRVIGEGLQYTCRLLVSARYPHLALYWGDMLFPSLQKNITPQFLTISIPEFPRPHIYVFPKLGLTVLLGTNYVGEHKMSFLRQYMWAVKQRGMLGMHAASKVLRLLSEHGGVRERNVLILGLSGTGKTTLTAHAHDLQYPESVIIRQDDIVTLTSTGQAFGTEENLYVKTEGLSGSRQRTLWQTASLPSALLENVALRDGKPDFEDTRVTSNGRAVIARADLAYTDGSIDLDRVDCIIFITRRNDIIGPVARLSRRWAALAFILGESVETSAGDPTKAGNATNVVGMNPFIIGSAPDISAEAEEGKRFLALLEKNPLIQCYLLNTGMVGEREKITPNDSARIMLEIARGTIAWKTESESVWGYREPASIPGIDLERFNLARFYTEEELSRRVSALREERHTWMKKFARELDPRIASLATLVCEKSITT